MGRASVQPHPPPRLVNRSKQLANNCQLLKLLLLQEPRLGISLKLGDAIIKPFVASLQKSPACRVPGQARLDGISKPQIARSHDRLHDRLS